MLSVASRTTWAMAKARIPIDDSRDLVIEATNKQVTLQVVWDDGTHWDPVKLSHRKAQTIVTWLRKKGVVE